MFWHLPLNMFLDLALMQATSLLLTRLPTRKVEFLMKLGLVENTHFRVITKTYQDLERTIRNQILKREEESVLDLQ